MCIYIHTSAYIHVCAYSQKHVYAIGYGNRRGGSSLSEIVHVEGQAGRVGGVVIAFER